MKYFSLSHNQLGEKGGQNLAPAIGKLYFYIYLVNSCEIRGHKISEMRKW